MSTCFNVFQLQAEKKRKSQFHSTMEALHVYTPTAYCSDIEALTPLFSDLQKPTVDDPKDAEIKITKDKKGVETETISTFKETVYNDVFKEQIKDNKSLIATICSIYNVTQGQCSK